MEFGTRSKSGSEIYDREPEPERKDSGPRGIYGLLIVRKARTMDCEELRRDKVNPGESINKDTGRVE